MRNKKDINIFIGKNIQQAREQAGLTQDEMSSLIGIGEKSLSAIERGAVGISISNLKRICQLLSVTSDSLIFGSGTENGEREEAIDGIAEKLRSLSSEEFKIVRSILLLLIKAMKINR